MVMANILPKLSCSRVDDLYCFFNVHCGCEYNVHLLGKLEYTVVLAAVCVYDYSVKTTVTLFLLCLYACRFVLMGYQYHWVL